MRIWHISDTHGYHNQLKLPENIDLIIHSGDCSNQRDPIANIQEVMFFIQWYCQFECMKIYIPGNHDTSIEKNYIKSEDFTKEGIIYLENEDVILNNIKFTGIPYTPSFNNWAFGKSRETLIRTWEKIPKDTNVLITHGPPKGILDLTENKQHLLEQVGDSALYKTIQKYSSITHHLFGHIHSFKNCLNHGIYYHNNKTYSNACVLEDGKFEEKGIIFNGNIIEI